MTLQKLNYSNRETYNHKQYCSLTKFVIIKISPNEAYNCTILKQCHHIYLFRVTSPKNKYVFFFAKAVFLVSNRCFDVPLVNIVQIKMQSTQISLNMNTQK